MALHKITDPTLTPTIEEFISFKSENEVSYNNLSFRDRYDNLIYPIKNIIDDYKQELMELVTDVTMSEEEFLKYRYKPKVLANYLYGNPELDFIILTINGMCNMKEFNSRKVKLINKADLNEFLTSIFNANKKDLDLYNSWNYSTTS